MTALRVGVWKSRRRTAVAVPPLRFVLAMLLAATVLSPEITLLEGFYKPRGEDVILLAVLVVWGLRLPRRRAQSLVDRERWNARVTAIMVGMMYVAAISIGVGAIAFEQPLVINDLMILPMIARYWLVLQVGQWTQRTVERRTFFWALVASLGASALIGVLQYFNLLGINSWLTPHYASGTQAHVGLDLVRLGARGARVIGTNGDPRHYAYMLVLGMALCFVGLLYLRKPSTRVIMLTVFVLCLVAMMFTASRTAVLSSASVLLVGILLSQEWGKTVATVAGLGVLLMIAMLFLAPVLEDSTFSDRVLTTDSVSFDRSLNARIRDLTRPFDFALENPIVWFTGRGPSKAAIRTDSHNDFGWYFLRFGLPGLALYLGLLVYGIRLGLYVMRTAIDPVSRAVGLLTVLATLNWAVYAMAENIFKQPQLMALNMWVIGASMGIARADGDSSTLGKTGQ